MTAVRQLARRGFRLSSLLDFWERLLEGDDYMPHFDPRCLATERATESKRQRDTERERESTNIGGALSVGGFRTPLMPRGRRESEAAREGGSREGDRGVRRKTAQVRRMSQKEQKHESNERKTRVR